MNTVSLQAWTLDSVESARPLPKLDNHGGSPQLGFFLVLTTLAFSKTLESSQRHCKQPNSLLGCWCARKISAFCRL